MADPTPFDPDPTYDNSPNQGSTADPVVAANRLIYERLNGLVIIRSGLPNCPDELQTNSERTDAEFKQYLLRRRRIRG